MKEVGNQETESDRGHIEGALGQQRASGEEEGHGKEAKRHNQKLSVVIDSFHFVHVVITAWRYSKPYKVVWPLPYAPRKEVGEARVSEK
jgi:hypothetical protein